MKFGTQINLNMVYSMDMLKFYLLDQKYLFFFGNLNNEEFPV